MGIYFYSHSIIVALNKKNKNEILLEVLSVLILKTSTDLC